MDFRHTVLCIDDEENILRALRRLLRPENYALVTTTSPQQALELVQEHPVSVVVADQRMPGMTGVELLGRCKHLAPHAARILLTGYADMAVVVQAVNAGEIFRYLAKPWKDEDLRHEILQGLVLHDLLRCNSQLVHDLKEENLALEAQQRTLEQQLQAAMAQNRQLVRIAKRGEGLLVELQQALAVLGRQGTGTPPGPPPLAAN